MPLYQTLAALLVSGVLLHAAEAAYARAPERVRPVADQGAPAAPPAGHPLMVPNTLVPGSLHDTHGSAFTPDDAAREIQRRHGGRVLAVQPDGAGYRVKMLKDGEVRIYQVNP